MVRSFAWRGITPFLKPHLSIQPLPIFFRGPMSPFQSNFRKRSQSQTLQTYQSANRYSNPSTPTLLNTSLKSSPERFCPPSASAEYVTATMFCQIFSSTRSSTGRILQLGLCATLSHLKSVTWAHLLDAEVVVVVDDLSSWEGEGEVFFCT